MALSRTLACKTSAILLGACALVTACGTPSSTGLGSRSPTSPYAKPGAPGLGGRDATGAARRLSHRPRETTPARTPPPNVVAPMKGEPSGAALSETRLVQASCETVSAEDTETLVKEMRKAVATSFKEWHAGQMDCWEADREEYRLRKEQEGAVLTPRAMPSSVMDASSAGFGSALSAGASPPAKAAAREAGGGAAAKPDVAQARRASGTNNQVASVDEADIVKTDGRYVYLATNGALRIVEAMNPRVVSVTKLSGTSRELFVEGDRAVVYTSSGGGGQRCTYGYDCTFGGDGSATTVHVFDIKDRTQPRLVRELELSGSLLAARRIGSAVHTVVADADKQGPQYETWPSDLPMCGTDEAKVRARFAKLTAENERKIRARTSLFPTLRENGTTQAMCNGGLLRTRIRDGQAFTSVVSFDLLADGTPPTTATLQSRPGAVFASRDALYLSVVHQKQGVTGGRWYSFYGSVDEVSEIHKFKIGTSPRETRYLGSGVVPGHVLNQFAMDEWHGYLRVATTRGRVPDPNVSSAVSVLAESAGGNLTRVGAVEGIAPGEDIRAVRFDDDRGYVVTFKKTDPLFVVDLFQPSRPRILGELKIPGFSTYIHRIDPDHLLSIGFDANDHGDFAYFDGVILQLFDVKNATEPKLIHKEKIGTRGSSSQAATDHLAFNFVADEGLLAIPMTICEGGGDGTNGNEIAFSGLLVYDVDVDRGFTRLGGVDHGREGVSCGTWWSNATSAVKRSVFLDDLVYSIAPDRVKVQKMGRFGENVADISMLP